MHYYALGLKRLFDFVNRFPRWMLMIASGAVASVVMRLLHSNPAAEVPTQPQAEAEAKGGGSMGNGAGVEVRRWWQDVGHEGRDGSWVVNVKENWERRCQKLERGWCVKERWRKVHPDLASRLATVTTHDLRVALPISAISLP